MYISKFKAKNLKGLEEFSLSLERPDGSPRLWTALIGEREAVKTRILQAIALSAAGRTQINSLVSESESRIINDHKGDGLSIASEFVFDSLRPHLEHESIRDLRLSSKVSLLPKQTSFRAGSKFINHENGDDNDHDPLDVARSKGVLGWFVACYGLQRNLSVMESIQSEERLSLERLKHLFNPNHRLTSILFAAHFGSKDKGSAYAKIMSLIIEKIFGPDKSIAREIDYEGVQDFAIEQGGQATIAWISDLVGHLLLETRSPCISGEGFSGLVLVEGIEQGLHPKWQSRLVPALRSVFPKMQFLVTTNSPVILASFSTEEVVEIHDGKIEPLELQSDPRGMTATEVFYEYFGFEQFTLNIHGGDIRSYSALASNPCRNDYQQEKLQYLKKVLKDHGVENLIEPVAREPELD